MSPYKDKGRQKEAVKKAMQKRRHVIPDVIPDKDVIPLPKVHSLLKALVDPEKRGKLVKICVACERHDVGGMVYYGMPGAGGVSIDDVREYLKATE